MVLRHGSPWFDESSVPSSVERKTTTPVTVSLGKEWCRRQAQFDPQRLLRCIARAQPSRAAAWVLNQRGTAMKLFRRKFLHLAAGAAALPALSRIARAQAY